MGASHDGTQNVAVGCLLVIVTILAISGVVMWGISCLPFEMARARFLTLTKGDGSNGFTAPFFAAVVTFCRALGTVLVGLAAALCAARRWASQVILSYLASSRRVINGAAQHLSRALKAEDAVHLVALIVLFLIAIAMRLSFLFQPIRNDEAATFVYFAYKPLYRALSFYNVPNNHLFHTFLVHVACSALGSEPWVIRLPALVAGVFMLPASYLVARIYYSKSAALLAAALIATSSPLIEYSTNGRGYTLLCLIFLLLLALAAYLRRSTNPVAWLTFSTLSALGFYTIPIMLYPFGIVVVWLLLSIWTDSVGIQRRRLLRVCILSLASAAVLTLLLYSPVFAVSGWRPLITNQFVTPLSWSQFIAGFPRSLPSLWEMWNRDIPVVVRPLFIAGFVTSTVRHPRLSRCRVPIALAAVIWLVPVALFQRVVPFARVWLFLLPVYFIVACSGVSWWLKGLESSRRKGRMYTLLVLAVSLWFALIGLRTQSVYYSDETGTFRDAGAMVLLLKEHLQPGDCVLAASRSNVVLEYYFRESRIPLTYLQERPDASCRWWVLVDETSGQSLDSVLHAQGVLGVSRSVAEVVARYESGAVYVITRSDCPGRGTALP